MSQEVYEIINPSDAMTMKAPSLLVAGVSVALLGLGKLGVKGTPILLGWDEWFAKNGITDLSAWIQEHRAEISAALRSVALGSLSDRADYDTALAAINDPDKRKAFIKDRNDRRRSSVNDWESWAHELADRIDQPGKVKT